MERITKIKEVRVVIEDMKLYQQLVNTKADTNSSDILPNAGEKHAAIAMEKLFEKTRASIKMVLGSFSDDVCNQPNYLKGLKDCMERNITFQIIFLEKRNKKSLAYQLLASVPNKVKFFDASEKTKEHFFQNNGVVHFSVFDDDKFRYETDTEKFEAWFSFNDKFHAETLIRIFNSAIAN